MPELTIGQLARQAGVGVETVRFYERKGLIEEPPRRASGYRQYPADAALRLRFIRRAQKVGFSLDEVGELLRLRVAPETSCTGVQQRVEAKIRDVDAKIADLRRMRQTLAGLRVLCQTESPSGDCPILEALEGEQGV